MEQKDNSDEVWHSQEQLSPLNLKETKEKFEKRIDFYLSRSNSINSEYSSPTTIKPRRVSEYINNKKNGKCIWLFKSDDQTFSSGYTNSPIKGQGFFSDGKKSGEFVFYYKNGTIKQTIIYKDNKRHGTYKCYYENQRLALSGEYHHDERHGYWNWYYKNNKLKCRGKYFNGFKQGKWQFYYFMEEMESEGSFIALSENKDTEKKSIVAKYPIYDFIEAHESCYEEVPFGNWVYYFDNGQVKCYGDYNSKGVKIGKWVKHFSNGEMDSVGSYNLNGSSRKIDLWQEFYRTGSLKSKGKYSELGQKTGFWEFYHQNGELSSSG